MSLKFLVCIIIILGMFINYFLVYGIFTRLISVVQPIFICQICKLLFEAQRQIRENDGVHMWSLGYYIKLGLYVNVWESADGINTWSM